MHCRACLGGHFEKRESLSGVFQKFKNTLKEIFQDLNAQRKSTSICFSLPGYPVDDLEFFKWELNRENAIASKAESSNLLAHRKL